MLRSSLFRLSGKDASVPLGDKLRANKTNNPRIFTLDAPAPTCTGVAAIVGWLYSKPSTLTKYAEIYNTLGLDVVMCTPTWTHVMNPESGRELMRAVEQEVLARQNRNRDDKTCIFAASMGAYLTSMWTKDARARDSAMLKQIRCHAYDSPVDYDYVPIGIGNATFMTNPKAAKLMSKGIDGFLRLFPRVRQEHIGASNDFWNNPIKAPSCWFYSPEDAISPAEVCEKVMDVWEEKHGMDVSCERVVFKNTKHVTHFRNHPDQYRTALLNHVKKHLVDAPPKRSAADPEKTSSSSS